MDKSIVPVNLIAVRSSTCYEFSNPNGAVVVEIEDDPVEVVKKQMEELKLNHKFNEKNVPKVFQDIMKDKMSSLKKIALYAMGKNCTLILDEIEINSDKKGNDWLITYNKTEKTIKTDNPEKSIIDHFWFVLKNPKINLTKLQMFGFKNSRPENRLSKGIDYKKLKAILQTMFQSLNHLIQIEHLSYGGFNEDTFLSVLKHIKPGTLGDIGFDISWKQVGNYQKMEEIVETDQWKQAKEIYSYGVTPLKIEDLFQYEVFWLELADVTPEDVLGVFKHVFNSAEKKCCSLSPFKQKVNIGPILNFIKSQINGIKITKIQPIHPQDEICFEIVKSGKPVFLSDEEDNITIRNY